MTPRKSEPKYIAYYRVSTDRQGRSGLGLEAQKFAVGAFMARTRGTLKGEFSEIQSGKDDFRPQLREALRLCRLTNSTLLIAKIDRLSRNVAFLAALQDSKTKFVACDMPDANELTVNILAAVAQSERKAISERTTAALAAAKARGIRLGNPRLAPGNEHTAAVARQARIAKTQRHCLEMQDLIEEAQRQGHCTLRELACYLNELGIPSALNKRWHANSVSRLRRRNSSAGGPEAQFIAQDVTI
jgi:DNA invertase Pin-like site-specific DNA recombinase